MVPFPLFLSSQYTPVLSLPIQPMRFRNYLIAVICIPDCECCCPLGSCFVDSTTADYMVFRIPECEVLFQLFFRSINIIAAITLIICYCLCQCRLQRWVLWHCWCRRYCRYCRSCRRRWCRIQRVFVTVHVADTIPATFAPGAVPFLQSTIWIASKRFA